MQATTDTYQALWVADAALEWKINIDGVDYVDDEIISGTLTRDLMNSSEFGIGNVYVAEFECTVVISSTTSISRMAEVLVYCRLTDGETSSEWLQRGAFYINTRKQKGKLLTLSCYDAMLLGDQPFLTDGEELSYPLSQTTAVQRIRIALGVPLDPRTTIDSSYTMDYPNDMTMREVLAHIGVCNSGNWIITDTGALRLVVLSPLTTGSDFELGTKYEDGDFDETITIGRVTLYTDSTNGETSGEDDGLQLSYDCYWATSAMPPVILETLQDADFCGYTIDKAFLDPALEPGDIFSVGTAKYHLCNMVFTLSGRYAPYITAPIDAAVESEYTYSSVTLTNTVIVGETYEGVTITRSDGLTIERTDGSAKVVLNSQEFTFYVNGVKVLYFDPTSYTYRFVGDVQIDSGSINIGNAFIVDQNGNLSTYGNADLHGGTLTTTNGEVSLAVSSDGLKLMGTGELLKAMLGYNTADGTEYPYLLLGAGGGSSDTSGLVKKFWNGVWIGNSAPMNATGEFVAQSGYNGIFFNFSDDKAYIVNGANMQNVYTGEAIARFG